MTRDEQLFDSIQFISQTKMYLETLLNMVPFYGGTGAVLAEALNYFGKKKLWLFDTFLYSQVKIWARFSLEQLIF